MVSNGKNGQSLKEDFKLVWKELLILIIIIAIELFIYKI